MLLQPIQINPDFLIITEITNHFHEFHIPNYVPFPITITPSIILSLVHLLNCDPILPLI